MRSLFLIALLCCMVSTSLAQSPTIRFGTKSGTEYEELIVKRMQSLLDQYDLSKWIFTDTVAVESGVIPHSHPVLTLSTRNKSDDDLLSTFLHEQIHWYGVEKDEQVEGAIKDFKEMYPKVPVGNRQGARDEFSTYLHLFICYLEYKSMKALVGEKRATTVMENMNHYQWIYRQVLDHNERIGRIVKKHDLDL